MAHETVCAHLKQLPIGLIVAFAFCWDIDPSSALVPLLPISERMFIAPLFLAAFFFVFAVGNRVVDPLLSNRKILVIVSVCGFIGALFPMILSIQGLSGEIAWRCLASALMTLFQAFAMLTCLKRLSMYSMVDVLLSLIGWQLCVALLELIASVFPSNIIELAACLIIPVLLHRQYDTSQNTEAFPLGIKRESGVLPVRLMVINALVVFVIYALRRLVPEEAFSLSHCGSLIAVVVMIVLVAMSGKIVRMRHLYNASLVLYEIAIILLAVGSFMTLVAAAMFADGAYAAFSVFFFTILCNIGLRYNVNTTLLFSSAYVAECMGAFLGSFPAFLPAILSNSQTLFPVILSAFIVVAFTCFSTDEDYRTTWGTSKVKKGFVDPTSYYYSLSEICTTIAMQYALSNREADVLLLLAQKKTASTIASELVISNATVKTHMHNIYKKLQIHSKQELFELIGCVNSPDESRLL